MATSNQKIEISLKTIFLTIGTLLGLYFLYQIREIILFIFIGFLLMAALRPIVQKLQSWKINRGISIGVIYLLMLGLIVVAIAAIVPPLVSQIATLISQIPVPPDLANNLKHINLSLQDFQVIANQLTSVPRIFEVIGSTFSGVVVFISLLVFSFYLLLDRDKIVKSIVSLHDDQEKAKKTEKYLDEAEEQIGGWVRAEFILMVIVGVMTFIGLTALRINYALSLAIVAGLLEILPNLGPTISAVPAAIVAYLTVSPVMAIAVIALYIFVQQVEGNLIVPMVMRQAVGLSPVVTILLLLIGFKMAGVTGAALGIPIFLVGKVVVTQLFRSRKQFE